jgi:hypothetical protein
MSKSQEKRVERIAQTKGFRLEKVGKGSHHGRFAIVNVVEGARISSGSPLRSPAACRRTGQHLSL